MPPNPRVILYGNSVFLAGLKAELKSRTALEPETVETGYPNAARLLRARSPDIVIFDLVAAQPDFAISLLRDWPGLLLIGVDPTSDNMLVLSGRQAPAVTTMDLMQVIATQSIVESSRDSNAGDLPIWPVNR